jgi:hypothetical protein
MKYLAYAWLRLALCCMLSHTAAHAGMAWTELAKRLSGESGAVHQRTIQELRLTPGLSLALEKLLANPGSSPGDDTFLAFDVISTLRLLDLLPALISYSEFDSSGYSYNAINSLVTPGNQAKIVALYRTRVLADRTSPAARMVLLDTLARFHSALDEKDLESMLHDPAVEVRATALSHIRTFLLLREHAEYYPLLQIPLKEGSPTLQAQARALMSELSAKPARSRP